MGPGGQHDGERLVDLRHGAHHPRPGAADGHIYADRTPTLTATATPTPSRTFTPTPTPTGTVEMCNQTLSAPFGPPSAANTWQQFTIPLTAATFNVDSATFQKVMSQVTQFRIRTEMHDGSDVGGVDNIAVGSRFNASFDAGPEGWTAAGDGTMEWKSSGGNPGGYLQISDWASGDWHWAVAPVNWAGDWRNLVNSSIAFDLKTNYPDYASTIEVSCTQTKRLILTADPFVIPQGGSSNMTVGLSESAAQAVVVSLNSSAPSCITVPASVTVAQGQTSAMFIAQVAAGATPGCETVIEASQAAYGVARLTLRVASVTDTPTLTRTPTATASRTLTPTPTRTPGGCGEPGEAGTVVRTLVYHQLTSFTSFPESRWQTGLHPLGRREPRRFCDAGRSFSRLCHQYGWHGAARGGHGSRRLGADSGHQRRWIEGVVERPHQGAHRQCGRHWCA